jgi:hypothetical protein
MPWERWHATDHYARNVHRHRACSGILALALVSSYPDRIVARNFSGVEP